MGFNIDADHDTLRQWYDVQRVVGTPQLLITNFTLPAGWLPQEVQLLLRYNHHGPYVHPRLYLPEQTRYVDGPAPHFTDKGPDGWRWYCIHRLNTGQSEDIVDLLQLLMASLNHPEDDLPTTEQDQSRLPF